MYTVLSLSFIFFMGSVAGWVLELFFRRFFSGQFKRSCAPDSAAITDVNLLGEGFFLPSDASPREFLREIDQLKFELGGTEQ